MIKTITIFLYISGILALGRLIPHPPNFTPILAAAIFAPYMVNDKWLAMAVPLTAMFMADIIIGFHPFMIWVYGAIGLSTLISYWSMQFGKKYMQLGVMALVSSILFFVITNFAVWIMYDSYPKTLEGLMLCYTMAIPFFQNTLYGTIIYTALMAFMVVALSRPVNYTYLLVVNKGKDYAKKYF
jgi:hypothetical protein